MGVGDGVAGDDIGGDAIGQVLVGGIAGVEAVAAVGVEGQAGDRGVERIAQRRGVAVVDIAVVGGDRAGDGAVFEAGIDVGDRDRRVVGAGDGDGQRRGVGGAMRVGDGVAGDDDRSVAPSARCW